MAQIDYGCTIHSAPTASPRSWWQKLTVWRMTARSRRGLVDLDPHLLRDVGLTGKAADEEAKRPFWDVPAHWLK